MRGAESDELEGKKIRDGEETWGEKNGEQKWGEERVMGEEREEFKREE